MRAYIVIFALALVRAVFVTFATDTALSLPWVSFALDGIFVVYSLYWLLKRNNNKAFNFLYILPIFGSVLFEYQYGLVALLLFSPFIYLLYRHKNELSNTSLLGLIVLLLKFVLYPLWIFVEIFNSVKSNKSKVSVFNNYSLYVVVGVSVGLLILGALALLDPEFAKWLANIEDILEFLGKILLYLLGYTAAFLWFIYGAATVSYETATVDTKLASVLRWGALVSTAVFVGYSLYDVYIVLRVLKVIELAFETMGKNTQLYFVEMVVMGGLIFFLISFILEKINSGKAEEHEKNHSRVFKHIVIITSLFLLPPIYNLLRALLGVYIPEFGLTVRRLFGIYSATAFLITFAFVVVKAYSKSKSIFAQSLVVFFITLQILSFVVPNNAVIFNWHFNRYMTTDKADINYMTSLRLGKWASLFKDKLENQELTSDVFLKWYLFGQTENYEKSKELKEEFLTKVNKELDNVSQLLRNEKFSDPKLTYFVEGSSQSDTFEYENGLYMSANQDDISNLNLYPVTTEYSYTKNNSSYRSVDEKEIPPYFQNHFSTYGYSSNDRIWTNYISQGQINMGVQYNCSSPEACSKAYDQNRNSTLSLYTFLSISGRSNSIIRTDSILPPVWFRKEYKYIGEEKEDDLAASICDYSVNYSYKTSCITKVLSVEKEMALENDFSKTGNSDFHEAIIDVFLQFPSYNSKDTYDPNPSLNRPEVRPL